MGAKTSRQARGSSAWVAAFATTILLAGCGSATMVSPSPSPASATLAESRTFPAPPASARPSPAPTLAPSPSPAATLTVIPASLVPAHRAVVVAGDTLSGIATDHRLPLQVVLDANPWIVDPKLIHPGDTIEIPHVAVLADFAMVPAAGTEPAGQVEAVIASPTDWPQVPGTFRFDAAPGSELRAIRGVVEQVGHWYDPGFPSPGLGGTNVAYVLGHECQYWTSRQPTCRDINWMFVDVLDPTLTDSVRWCTWTDGRRPPFPADGNDWCADGRPGTEFQAFAVTDGSLKVVFNE